jgi:hypothetical protein
LSYMTAAALFQKRMQHAEAAASYIFSQEE